MTGKTACTHPDVHRARWESQRETNARLDEQLDDHEARLRALERQRHMIAGAYSLAGSLLGGGLAAALLTWALGG